MSDEPTGEPDWIVQPAPEIIMAANGVYWRRFSHGLHPESGLTEPMLSMVPVSDDNDPVIGPLAVYRVVGWEDHDGSFHEMEARDV
jgi:hypothetical protein